MSTNVILSKGDRQCILIAVSYWLETISQEDTNEDELLNMVRLRDQFKELCPWID